MFHLSYKFASLDHELGLTTAFENSAELKRYQFPQYLKFLPISKYSQNM